MINNCTNSIVADSVMVLEIVEQILLQADTPGQTSHEVVEKMREITGARAVLLLQPKDEDRRQHEVVVVLPKRRNKREITQTAIEIADNCQHLTRPTYWQDLKCNNKEYFTRKLNDIDMDCTVITPLIAGYEYAGSLVLLGLPEDEHGKHLLLNMLQMLSKILALVINSAQFYERQEKMIKRRTSELIESNYALIEENKERQKVEEELQSLRHYLSNIIDAMPSILIGVDNSMMITWWNKTAGEHIGIPPRKDQSISVLDVLPELADELQVIENCLRTMKPTQIWKHRYKSSGVECCVNILVYPFESLGRQEVMIRIDDITDQVALEDEKESLRIAKEQAESANKLKDEFLANASHELRTPLNSILGHAQILDHQDDIPEKISNGIQAILGSGKHLLELINEILDLSKLTAGKTELSFAEINLVDLLQICSDMVQAKIKDKDLVFKLTCKLSKEQRILTDEVRLRQIILNLLSNATKFTSKGYVELAVKKLSGDIIRFEVNDTGCGIPRHMLASIFKPFIQTGDHLHSTEGTGLGLAISSKLVRLLGGELTATSNVSQGSSFFFEIPVGIEQQNVQTFQISARPEKENNVDGTTVMVVDDVDNNRLVLAELLMDYNYNVIEASSGYKAIEIAAAKRPEIIIMDIMMPGMNGIDATRHIRSETPEEYNPRIIALSAATSTSNQQEALGAGCNAFLTKPYDETTLLKEISITNSNDRSEADDREQQSELTDLPQALRDQLKKAINTGNLSMIHDTIKQLRDNSQGENEQFVDTIESLANNFEFDKLQQFVRQAQL